MRKMRTELAVLELALSGAMLLGAAGCNARPPTQSQPQSVQIRPEPPRTVEQRLAAFTAARPLATAGVINAVIPERHILQVQGIEPQSVAIGQVIEIVADIDSENPIHGTVFDRQQGFLQVHYGDDAGRSPAPRTGDIAFCYLSNAAAPQRARSPAPQRVESSQQNRTAPRFLVSATTKPFLASLPSNRLDAGAEAAATQATKPIDLPVVAELSVEEEPSPSVIREVRKLSVAAAPQSQPALPPDQVEAGIGSRLLESTVESQSTPTQPVADSQPADLSPDRPAPARASDAAPSQAVGSVGDLRTLLGVQLSGHRHVEVPKLPPISVQGYVHADGGEQMALLQIGDARRVYLVKKNTEIPITVAGNVTPVGKNELTGLPGPKGSDIPADAAPKGAQESVVILKVLQITTGGVILETGLAETLTVR